MITDYCKQLSIPIDYPSILIDTKQRDKKKKHVRCWDDSKEVKAKPKAESMRGKIEVKVKSRKGSPDLRWTNKSSWWVSPSWQDWSASKTSGNEFVSESDGGHE
jgi:hypothetical protein